MPLKIRPELSAEYIYNKDVHAVVFAESSDVYDEKSPFGHYSKKIRIFVALNTKKILIVFLLISYFILLKYE
jgi:hypothetical protein